MDDEKCTCQAPRWCGATRRDVIRVGMSKGLNADQAEADFDSAQAIRRERGMVIEEAE